MELRPLRWLPVVVLTVAVLCLILTESILAGPGTVEIIQPGQDAVIAQQSTPLEIRGTATDDNLAYYHLEYGVGGRQWLPIGATRYTHPVRDGVLAVWDISRVPPGRYRLRLELVDAMGNQTQSTIEVTVVAGRAECTSSSSPR